MNIPTSFGEVISDARKRRGITQKQVAASIKLKGGASMSPQYFNDIERGRRVPSNGTIRQMAVILSLDSDYLHFLAGRWPDDVMMVDVTPQQVHDLMQIFRNRIQR